MKWFLYESVLSLASNWDPEVIIQEVDVDVDVSEEEVADFETKSFIQTILTIA